MEHATVVSLLQESCRELQLSDATLLPAATRKMCRALAALPPMEAFVRDVCAIALSRGGAHSLRAPIDDEAAGEAAAFGRGKVPSTKLVLAILRAWAKELNDLQQHLDFTQMLATILSKRALPGGGAAPKPTRNGRAGSPPMNMRDLAHAVEELVTQERKGLAALDAFERADAHVAQQIKVDDPSPPPYHPLPSPSHHPLLPRGRWTPRTCSQSS